MTTTDPAPAAPAAPHDDTISRDDRGVLLGCDEPSYRDYLATALRARGFKLHHADTHEWAIRRLASRVYTLVVFIENLEGSPDLAGNALLTHLANRPIDEHHRTFVTLLGQSVATGDDSQAYALSVDLLVHYQDVSRLAELVVPALEEQHETDRHFREARELTR